MKDFFDILKALKNSQHQQAIIASVVKTKGSVYRRPGAKMIIFADGTTYGTISGGCLESDLIDRARKFNKDLRYETVVYDMMSGDDLIWGLGLGCNGEVHVLLEQVQVKEYIVKTCLKNYDNHQHFSLATIFDSPVKEEIASKALFDQKYHSASNNEHLNKKIRSLLKKSLAENKTFTQTIDGREILFESCSQFHLNIFGAGFDAIPLAQTAQFLGWEVNIFDQRPEHVRRFNQQSFTNAKCCRASDYDHSCSPKNSASVIMTHNYLHDLAFLKKILPYEKKYIGLLGPKSRKDQLLAEVGHIKDEHKQIIYGPAGLDIGAENCDEIAISIIAEIQAVIKDHKAGFLALKQGNIHEP